ncbi:molybdopterin-binding protein [Geobacter sp.]|uniref:molybdopterin-binding protein n=1 Tax=Geobacter sp. TaxID=46610 RepID=UPI00261DAB35|nr:molybdopterin-binding protein [Geobacter sp.]
MSEKSRLTRRNFLTRLFVAASATALGGCQKLSESPWFVKILGFGEKATRRVQRLVLPRKAVAQEFTEAELSPQFRSNGTFMPRNPAYLAMAEGGFAGYRLEVGGLVEHPGTFSLADIRALPSREQITRHDCVEGWSAIGKWKGARLSALLEAVQLKPTARYVVFHCADPMGEDGSSPYYESIDLEDAFHPQTILAYELNGETLPVKNGAPLRLRLERQLGYKMAKYVMRLEVVEDFSHIAGGKGGYWEDRGYEWYAGI